MNIITKTMGRCLTERKRDDFDLAVSECHAFGLVSQFSPQPRITTELVLLATKFEVGPRTPIRIDYGTILYGIRTCDGELMWLGEIIDSSD